MSNNSGSSCIKGRTCHSRIGLVPFGTCKPEALKSNTAKLWVRDTVCYIILLLPALGIYTISTKSLVSEALSVALLSHYTSSVRVNPIEGLLSLRNLIQTL